MDQPYLSSSSASSTEERGPGPRTSLGTRRQQCAATRFHRGGFGCSVGRRSLSPGTGDVNRVAPTQDLGVVTGKQPAFGDDRFPVQVDWHRHGCGVRLLRCDMYVASRPSTMHLGRNYRNRSSTPMKRVLSP